MDNALNAVALLPLFAAESFWTDPNSWLAMLKVGVFLGAVIFVHELGHFLVAKWCGVKCEKFYLGFDFFDIKIGSVTILPRALVKFQWGETEYGIGIIPLGGYVKMLGQDDNPANARKEAERSRMAAGEEEGGVQQVKLNPRSYQAKSVPQRMAIISAGVIMNLIFAVIFATVAYALGVSYTPCEIASTVPGDPAWKAGLEPGDRIIQLGRRGDPSDHLRFEMDLRTSVVMTGVGNNLDLLVRSPDGKERWVTVQPTQAPDYPIPTIGLSPMASLTVAARPSIYPYFPAGKASPAFQGGDKLTAVKVNTDDGPKTIELNSYLDYQAALAAYPNDPLTFVVERKPPEDAGANQSPQTLEIEVGVTPRKGLGLLLKAGPISAIRGGSPAEKAGFQVGDRILKVNGEELVDPFALPHILSRLHGEPIEVVVERSGDVEGKPAVAGESAVEQVTIQVTPEAPKSYVGLSVLGQEMHAEALGFVFPVLNEVAGVMGPAVKEGIRAGDQIVAASYLPPPDSHEEISTEPIDIGPGKHSFLLVDDVVQFAEPGGKFQITYVRGDQEKTAILTPVELEGHNPERGLRLDPKTEIHTADSFGEAIALGGRETWESGLKVVVFLKKLLTGGVSVKHLGGPGTIAYAATAEAKEGIPRLLIFLTLLSANLAVVNFLPVPVLDGGHMMFLAFEGIRGKPLNEKWVMNLTVLGFAFVVGLMLFVIGLDVFRFTGLM